MANKNPKIDNGIARSKQNLSCNWTGSADFGRLIPIHWEELVQGDHVIKCSPRIEMQLLPLASPTFGKIDLYCHYFVVPLRQCWDSFYEFWSRTGTSKDKVIPYLTPYELGNYYLHSPQSPSQRRALYKHWTSLGLNPFFDVLTAEQVNALDNVTPLWYMPFAAYNKIWWDFYRDPEVLRDESKSQYLYTGDRDGDMTQAQDFAIKYMYPHVRSIKNCWISDLYSSSGLLDFSVYKSRSEFNYSDVSGDKASYIASDLVPYTVQDSDALIGSETSRINRLVESLTRLSERLSLSGKREIEALFARYNVKPNYAQMNLARYVGGAKSQVMIENLISSADTDADGGLPLGAKAGAGYCALNDLNIEVSVDEPSILMGIVSVMPHIHYVQGLSKKWQRKNLQDMFQENLQYVGQVAVAKREVGFNYNNDFITYDKTKDGDTFAFAEPYYEYHQGLDILAGDFMKYHNLDASDPSADRSLRYMQSMEQYIDFPQSRQFNLNNLLVDGNKFNKIFTYLGGAVDDDVDDHFHLSIEKEVLIDRPMEGYPIPTLETTQQPHADKTALSGDTML